MGRRTYLEIKELVEKHNQSTQLSNQFVICQIWKESGFDDSVKNADSTATGLMQLTKAAVTEVNKKIAPAKVSYAHTEMTDAAKNIECGTYYLDLRIRWAKDKTKGIDGFGTGPGYAKNIFSCEDCMQKDAKHWQACLHKIHR
jgi:hypothetical protein